MSRRRELEQHRQRLNETREIMSSMKALAFMETRKLSRFIEARRAVVEHIDHVAEDFFSFYPATLPLLSAAQTVYLLLGSERGFCGDFNESLVETLFTEQATQQSEKGQQGKQIIAIGNKLCGLLGTEKSGISRLDGISVVEDIEEILIKIVDTLKRLQKENAGLSLRILYHDPDRQEIINSP